MRFPDKETLEAFRASSDPKPLDGGQGISLLAGNVVLKPTDDPAEAEWTASVFETTQQSGFRLSMPVRAPDGSATFQGWTAFELIHGETVTGTHFTERFQASLAFHHAIRNVEKPPGYDSRTDPWSVACRTVWHGEHWNPSPIIAGTLELFYSMLEPVDTPWQIVHGDIAGNILLHPDLPPAIIDFSPHYNPAGAGEAVMVVDAVIWEGARLEALLELGSQIPAFEQLVVRSAARRLLETDCHHQIRNVALPPNEEVDRYLALALELKGRRTRT